MATGCMLVVDEGSYKAGDGGTESSGSSSGSASGTGASGLGGSGSASGTGASGSGGSGGASGMGGSGSASGMGGSGGTSGTSGMGGSGGTSGMGGSGGTSGMGGSGVSTAGQLGDICSNSSTCASDTCLLLNANDKNIPGLCSAICTTSTDCGSAGSCVAQTSLGESACFELCAAASDCASGVPCIWDAETNNGVCQPVPTTLCSQLESETGCVSCLGTSCCSQYTACAEDVVCNQTYSSVCPNGVTCGSTLVGSSNAAAQALGTCLASMCTTQCE
jgi:hypothetical protein